MKKKLKKKKAPDEEGWRYEWISNAGTEMEESIQLMLNEVRKQKRQPEQWKNMRIKSITKKAIKRMHMNYKRGLFQTSILSKCMDRILLDRNKKQLDESLQPNQNGGVNERSIGDVLFIINNTIVEFKEEGKDLYILFCDLEKCFDKLYLKDCILELVEAGMPLEEAMLVYEMNRNIKAFVDTPHGKTGTFEIDEAVRQGTIFGTTLCGVSTNRINKMGLPEPMLLYETVEIGYPIFVDDKLGLGEPDTIREMVNKMRTLEVTKKYIYNIKEGKTEWMMIRNGRKKEKEEELELEVKRGKIGRATQYKYMGDRYDERGTNESKIEHKQEKLDLMIINIKRESCESKIGKAALTVRIMLIEVTIAPTVLGNTETWHNITKQEQQAITRTHHGALTRALNIPQTTPYMGIIAELDIWSFIEIVWYKKLMWFHRLMNSDDTRLAKLKLMDQIKQQDGWYSEVKEYAEKNAIVLDVSEVVAISYEKYKAHVKTQIQNKIHQDLWHKKTIKTKLRWINPGKRQQYIEECTIAEASAFLRIRLHMVKVLGNYGGGKCRRCGVEEESTEHVVECLTGGSDKYEEGRTEDINWLRKMNKLFKQFEEENSMNYDS